ncbi:zinc finger protein 93-like [Plutella xylostella]|uniref:zinc finger protein 93-like n=1 Tax=Plutella xylostella TaxID=51655 RepID=UPI0020327EAB|nr:zinc finger protein 93-like [Plutella xylostella]XP_048479961.1 zinc finger protein 93-like [Plutella xylostella]
MEDDIDIEEHDLLNNPVLDGVFPDLTILKSEIVDFNISAETLTKTQVPERNANQVDGTLAENSGSLPPVCPAHDTDVKPDLLCTDIDDTKPSVSNNLSESDRIVSQVKIESEFFQLNEFNSNRIKLNSGLDVNSILEFDYNNIKKEYMCSDTEPDAVITINSYGENSRRITILKKYLHVNVVLTDCYTSVLNNNCYCAQCAVLFPTTEAYSEHYTSTHTETTHSNKASASLVCVKRKQIIYPREKAFVCDTCTKTFSKKSSLKEHIMLIHTGDKPFESDICKNTSRYRSAMKRQKLLHTGEKPFQCDICTKSFNQRGALKTHKLLHTAAKLFQCEECKKNFKYLWTLKRHKLIHSEISREKPFQCDICKKSFYQISHLKSHKLVHTGEKPFQCDICMKTFALRSNLKSHMLLHTGEKPFQCEICTKTFYRRCHLKRHMLQCHKLICSGESELN